MEMQLADVEGGSTGVQWSRQEESLSAPYFLGGTMGLDQGTPILGKKKKKKGNLSRNHQ